ncbi:MAG: FliI/YscN family ATPase [Planctomycetota bacterium]|nr:FliI/YscN family ATPase [Planctomycetota bacterium]
MSNVETSTLLRLAEETVKPLYEGRVEVVSGVMVEAAGVPAALGEICRIHRTSDDAIDAEVVGFRDGRTLLMPHGELRGIAPDQRVTALRCSFEAPVGDSLLGRVLDGFGAPLDRGPALSPEHSRPVHANAPSPLDRPLITEALQTGVRAIDGFTTLGRGQRLGIFAGSGVGKSSLLSQVTRNTDADVVVICLVGERGREVRAFIEDALGDDRKERSVLVAATSDRSPIERQMAPFVAMTIAEHFRDQGKNVLFVMDSVTRFATASREIGLAAGEPPTVRGYPPSFFATLPRLVERMGRTERGSITGLLTVLLDADDPNEPVADCLRGLLDGHIFLSRDLAERGHFPAVDIPASLSRLMPELVADDHLEAASRLRAIIATWTEGRDLVEIGAYSPGSNPALDKAIEIIPLLEKLTAQGREEHTSTSDCLEVMRLLSGVDEGSA